VLLLLALTKLTSWYLTDAEFICQTAYYMLWEVIVSLAYCHCVYTY